ncbi:cysteine desulfurase [Actinoallomurus rhizosphaericola]|uniref:cysteine desulfurase n=1 Tax=Actinoallomurus rhizosphaericola TaxID=2952536 RepID=UPI0027E2B101|nr:cysteine desulfurase [Actinoallomurus rhizosphaericola]
MSIDVERIRADFPILTRTVRDGKALVYLDSANTSQKPRQVIDAIEDYYARHNANIHRATHQLGEEATEAYEGARIKVANFIGAGSETEVVFTKNISEGINLVAYAMGNAATAGPEAERFRIGPGDEIVITEMEHHSNIVPWQLLAQRTGATLRWFRVTDDGRLDLSDIDELINERTKIVAVAHQSNVLGTINPVRLIADKAHAVGALVLADGAQAVPHMRVNVQELGVDFYGFTAHKLCGPTGIGVLWGRAELLETLPPFLGGGEMIETVAMEGSTFAPPPHKFEAGTMPIAEAAGLGAAIDYLNAVGIDDIAAQQNELLAYALKSLTAVEGVRILGPAEAEDRGTAISFTLEGPDGREIHPHDVSQVLDAHGIAVRAGHHCARPLHRRFGVTASTRASLYFYNTTADVDALVEGLRETQKFFGSA